MKLFAGIDLGGTNIAAGLVEGNQIVFKTARPTKAERGYEAIVRDLAEVCAELTSASEERGNRVGTIGIGIPGIPDKARRFVYFVTNLGWKNKPLCDDIEAVMKTMGVDDVRITLDNDANAAAVAEFEAGAMKGVENGILLTLGTGIGGGLILNGKPFRGSYGLGSEIGHMVVGDNFYSCSCGKNGCFETFSSATALIKYYQKLQQDAQITVNEGVTAKDILDAAKAHEDMAEKAFDRFTQYLAVGIVNLINILDPEIIAIGGGVSHAGDFLFDTVRQKVGNMLFVEDYPSARILAAELGNDAGIIGAAYLQEA